jgi:hypothetical protein
MRRLYPNTLSWKLLKELRWNLIFGPKYFPENLTTVEWLAFLLHIREISGSILGPEDGFPGTFVVFLCPYTQMLGQNFKIDHDSFLSYHSEFLILSSHSTLYNVCNWESVKATTRKNRRTFSKCTYCIYAPHELSNLFGKLSVKWGSPWWHKLVATTIKTWRPSVTVKQKVIWQTWIS